MKQHFFDLVRLWLRNYLKHPVENIRQADPIVPGRLYHNFGNVCKARPYNSQEKQILSEICDAQVAALTASFEDDKSRMQTIAPAGVTPEGIMEMVRSTSGNVMSAERIKSMLQQQDFPTFCHLCDFHKHGIPCPVHNRLKDGSTVCESHRYIIIKPVSHVF